MKNNNGFTLVEIISVVALLALIVIISVPAIGSVSKNIKKKTLNTKIENIEKAAVLYGQNNRYDQNNRENFNSSCSLCDGIDEGCYCFNDKITVGELASEGYIKYDEGTTDVLNSVDETKSILGCKIQIYQKYNKIYAVYLAKNTEDTTCWYK